MKAPIVYFTDGYDVVQREVVICRGSTVELKARSPALQSYKIHSTPRWASSSLTLFLSRRPEYWVLQGCTYHMSSSPHISKEHSRACYGRHTQWLFREGSFPRAKAGSLAGETEMRAAAELTVGWLADHLMLQSSTQKEEQCLPAASSLLSR